MPASRRTIISAAGAALASEAVRAGPVGPARASEDADVLALVRLSEESNAALLRGDVDRYRELIALTQDFTIMEPFGGKPSRAQDITAQRWESMRRFFQNGKLSVELVQAYKSSDMIVLALIEHAHVQVGALPAQDWKLRVTLVYQRDGSRWRLAHRHADPLAPGISLQEAASLAGRRSG